MTTKTHKIASQALAGDRESVTILYGAAGTGKTFGAVKAGLEWMGGLKTNRGKGKKHMIIVRPNESFAKDIGFLKGGEAEKMAPWMAPIRDNLMELGVDKVDIDAAFANGAIEVVPFAYIQGRTFHNSFIIMDECQNATFPQLIMTFTRVGRYSKLVYCGDVKQTSPLFRNSGFKNFIDACEPYDVGMVEFTKEDNMRSGVSKLGLEIQEDWEAKHTC